MLWDALPAVFISVPAKITAEQGPSQRQTAPQGTISLKMKHLQPHLEDRHLARNLYMGRMADGPAF